MGDCERDKLLNVQSGFKAIATEAVTCQLLRFLLADHFPMMCLISGRDGIERNELLNNNNPRLPYTIWKQTALLSENLFTKTEPTKV